MGEVLSKEENIYEIDKEEIMKTREKRSKYFGKQSSSLTMADSNSYLEETPRI